MILPEEYGSDCLMMFVARFQGSGGGWPSLSSWLSRIRMGITRVRDGER